MFAHHQNQANENNDAFTTPPTSPARPGPVEPPLAPVRETLISRPNPNPTAGGYFQTRYNSLY